MGMDVDLYVAGEVTDEELEAGSERFAARLPFVDEELERDWEGHVRLSSLSRYWAPGYERGDWPQIHSWIRALRAAFPGHAIRYGGDADFDDAVEVTDELLADYWAHWESPAWNAYHSRPSISA